MRTGWARFTKRLNLCGAGRSAASYWRDGLQMRFRVVSWLGSAGGIEVPRKNTSRTVIVADCAMPSYPAPQTSRCRRPEGARGWDRLIGGVEAGVALAEAFPRGPAAVHLSSVRRR
jgi:hypothetical protein